MTRHFIVVAGAVLLLAGGERNIAASSFEKLAAAHEQFQIEANAIGLVHAQRQDVRMLASQMLTEYLSHRGRLRIARSTSEPAGQTLTPGQVDDLKALIVTSGAQFDRLFTETQLKAHEQAAAFFRHFARRGGNGVLPRMAESALPRLEAHLSHVRGLAAAAQG